MTGYTITYRLPNGSTGSYVEQAQTPMQAEGMARKRLGCTIIAVKEGG